MLKFLCFTTIRKYPDIRVDNIFHRVAEFLRQHVSTYDTDCQYLSPVGRMWSIPTELGRSRSHEFRLQNVATGSVVLKKSVVEHQRIIAGLVIQRHNLEEHKHGTFMDATNKSHH